MALKAVYREIEAEDQNKDHIHHRSASLKENSSAGISIRTNFHFYRPSTVIHTVHQASYQWWHLALYFDNSHKKSWWREGVKPWSTVVLIAAVDVQSILEKRNILQAISIYSLFWIRVECSAFQNGLWVFFPNTKIWQFLLPLCRQGQSTFSTAAAQRLEKKSGGTWSLYGFLDQWGNNPIGCCCSIWLWLPSWIRQVIFMALAPSFGVHLAGWYSNDRYTIC